MRVRAIRELIRTHADRIVFISYDTELLLKLYDMNVVFKELNDDSNVYISIVIMKIVNLVRIPKSAEHKT